MSVPPRPSLLRRPPTIARPCRADRPWPCHSRDCSTPLRQALGMPDGFSPASCPAFAGRARCASRWRGPRRACGRWKRNWRPSKPCARVSRLRQREQIPQRHGCPVKGPGEARGRRRSGPPSRTSNAARAFYRATPFGAGPKTAISASARRTIFPILRFLAFLNWRFLPPAVALWNLSTPPKLSRFPAGYPRIPAHLRLMPLNILGWHAT